MAEMDLAALIIFVSGVLGTVIEPWSPQPGMMWRVGIIYFCVRITVLIIGNCRSYYKKGVKDDISDAKTDWRNHRRGYRSSRRLHDRR